MSHPKKPIVAGLDPKLLEILVCPVTKGPLVFDRERNELISERAHLADEARQLDDLVAGA